MPARSSLDHPADFALERCPMALFTVHYSDAFFMSFEHVLASLIEIDLSNNLSKSSAKSFLANNTCS